MKEEEKIITIEELPDEGSSSISKPIIRQKKTQIIEPRIKNLQGLQATKKIEEMSKQWFFGQKRHNFEWVIGLIILGLLEFLTPYQDYIYFLKLGQVSSFLDTLLRHPFLFSPVFLYFYSSSRNNREGFIISFDGIQTVQKILPPSSRNELVFVLIKWDEMTRLERDYVGEKEILKIFSIDGHIGDIIWYIEIHKKRAVLKLLKEMLIKDHPIIVFLENEKELK